MVYTFVNNHEPYHSRAAYEFCRKMEAGPCRHRMKGLARRNSRGRLAAKSASIISRESPQSTHVRSVENSSMVCHMAGEGPQRKAFQGASAGLQARLQVCC